MSTHIGVAVDDAEPVTAPDLLAYFHCTLPAFRSAVR